MSSNFEHAGRGRSLGRALIATLALIAASAVPASAATPGTGSASLSVAAQKMGKSLSGQGVKVLVVAPGAKSGRALSLPIAAVDPGSQAAATTNAALRFKKGEKSVRAGGLRFEVGAGVLRGKIGKSAELTIFRLPAPGSADATSGAVSLSGKLKLTGSAAKALKTKLGLDKSPAGTVAGALALSAKVSPTRESRAIAGGSAGWGVLESWREYVLAQIGPSPPAPPNAGTIELAGGATATGALDDPATTYGFPAAGGSFEKGLYGAADKLTLKTSGSVSFHKPGHCIDKVEVGDLEVKLDGPAASLTAGSFSWDIDQPGKGCTDLPEGSAPGTVVATLDTSGVTASVTGDGKTTTWSNIPAALTAEGAAAFAGSYEAGTPLDPITISVTTG